jgi:pseudoazurin
VHFAAAAEGHTITSIPGMLPAGAQPFAGSMNGDLTVKFVKPGIYGVRCLPHYAWGMIALIEVGDGAGNEQTAKAVQQSGLAKAKFAALFSQLDAKGK